MRFHPALRAAALTVLGLAAPALAHAQVLGTFPWQLQPFCNVVTLTLTSAPAGFLLDGTDDQCGATNKASAVGIASFNASGNVTLNITIVTAPSGAPVHVSAVVSPANGNGTWTDSLGNSGTFAFFGASAGLARPAAVRGGYKNVLTSGFINIPTTSSSFGTATTLATLTFTPNISGTAVLIGRGYCNVTTSTTGEVNVVLGTVVPGDSNPVFTEWAAIRSPRTSVSEGMQAAFFTQRTITVAAGVARTVNLKAFRELASTTSLNCIGSYSVTIQPDVLP